MSASPGGGDDLSANLDALQRDLKTVKEQQEGYRRFITMAMICLVILMLGFGWMLFGSVSRNLNGRELAAAAGQRWETLRPELEGKLSNALVASMPAYREQINARLPEVGPKIREDMTTRLEAFPERMHQELTPRLNEMLKRVAQQNAKDAKEIFPALSEQQAINVAERLEQEMLNQGVELDAHLDAKLQQEKDKLEAVLVKFDTSTVEVTDRETMQRNFVHKLILLMDHELMTDDDVEAGTTSLPPLPMPAAAPSTQPS